MKRFLYTVGDLVSFKLLTHHVVGAALGKRGMPGRNPGVEWEQRCSKCVCDIQMAYVAYVVHISPMIKATKYYRATYIDRSYLACAVCARNSAFVII
jgi:hypothetical protein